MTSVEQMEAIVGILREGMVNNELSLEESNVYAEAAEEFMDELHEEYISLLKSYRKVHPMLIFRKALENVSIEYFIKNKKNRALFLQA